MNIDPDLDIGAGRKPKAKIKLDVNPKYYPDIVGDICYLPLKDEVVNSVVCSHVIEHVEDVRKALCEIRRILKKNGAAIFFGPNDGSKMWNIVEPLYSVYYDKIVSKVDSPKTHLHSLSEAKIRAYLKNFFKSVEVGKINLGMEFFAICKK